MIFAGREIRTDYPKLGGWLGDAIGGYRDRDMNRSAIALVEIVKAFEASEQRILALEAALAQREKDRG